MTILFSVVLIVLGVLVSLFGLVLLIFYCRQDRLFYKPNRGTKDKANNEIIPDSGAVVYDDKEKGVEITF